MTNCTSLIAGSTGFLGSKILNLLTQEDEKIYCLSRRDNKHSNNNIEQIIINFDSLKEIKLPKVDHVYLCLGYELKAWELLSMPEKLKKPFYTVDYEYTLQIAQKSLESGSSSISLISAVGANLNSPSFYLKTKGKIEDEIKKLPFKKINIFRPGHLAGRIDWQRKKNDPRIDVFAFEMASLFFDPFMVSGLKKFRSINALKLAKSVIDKSRDNQSGINYMSYNDFIEKK